MGTIKEILPSQVSSGEAQLLAEVLQIETVRRSDGTPSILLADGSHLMLPPSVVELLASVMAILESGQGVSVVPINAELSTEEAAEILNVSRPHVVKLLETGMIPFHKVGTHRRIQLSEVLKYRDSRLVQFDETMKEFYEFSVEKNLPL